MTTIKLDIWQNKEGLTSLCFSGDLGEESRTILEPDSKIIHSFYADSHYDAMTKYYQYMDWGVYTTDFEVDKESYDLYELRKRAKIRKEIDIILWEDWDPIGVNDDVPRDEYQSYVQQILNLVYNNSSVDKLVERLFEIETYTMGLPGDKERCKKIAKEIKQRHANTM